MTSMGRTRPDAGAEVFFPSEEDLVRHALGLPVDPDRLRLPTEDDLPTAEGLVMESHQHVIQISLLMECLRLFWAGRQDIFITSNIFVYYSREQVRNQDYLGPDFFVVLDTVNRNRRSWVIWQENKGPDVVIEVISESTGDRDKGEKKRIYQDMLRVPEYYWYDPETAELAGFALRDGTYQPIEPDNAGRRHSARLGLLLTRWEGSYREERRTWLRWATLDGELLPTGAERAEHERARAEHERARADEAERRVAELEALLGRTPNDPDHPAG